MNAVFRPYSYFERNRDQVASTFSQTLEEVLSHNFFNSFVINRNDTDDNYTVEVPVPGLSRKDISIQIDDRTLWITAQRQEKKKTAWNSLEYNSMHFQRSFVLPEDIDPNAIRAKCRHGLLTIQFKKQKAENRVIQISSTNSNLQSWWNNAKLRTKEFFARLSA